MYKYAIIVSSDKGAKGERIDESGKLIEQILSEVGKFELVSYEILPDEKDELQSAMKKLADENKVSLILTTGGTGFSKRDIVPEATIEICDRLTPGITEAMRTESYKITNRAMLSRAASGIRGDTLIINMPGSPKAVRENLEILVDPLMHGLDIMIGSADECADDK